MTTLSDLRCEIEHEQDYAPDTEYTPTRLPAKVNPEYNAWLDMVSAQGLTCPDCGEPLDMHVQTGRKPSVQASCWTPGCLLNDVTRSLDFWTREDEAERDVYRAMNRKAVSA